MGLDGQAGDELTAQAEGPADAIGPHLGQEAIVVPGSATQSVTMVVERDPGHERPVDRIRGDLG
jgi:hypothetical protein